MPLTVAPRTKAQSVAYQRAARASSPTLVRLTPAARIEQPQRQPDRHDHHRAGQENAADLTDVGKPQFDNPPDSAHGVAEQRRRIEAERLENNADDEGNDETTISRTATVAGDPPAKRSMKLLVMTQDLDRRLALVCAFYGARGRPS
jgi:hypothetical protein